MNMTPSALEISGLSIASSDKLLVKGVNLAVKPREILALAGESGSGKSMTARAVVSLLPPGVRRLSGSIRLGGDDLTAMADADLRKVRGKRVGMVLQEPLSSLNPAMRIGDQLVEALLWHEKLSRREARQRAIAMLERVRIDDAEALLRAYPHEFSGGMRQRIMLASVFLLKPELIIADEPTTALDALAQREVLDLMVELGRDSGAAVLLITHNLALANRYADSLAVMNNGDIVESGQARAVLAAPAQPYTRKLVEAVPRRSEAAVPAPRADGDPLLSVRGLSVEYPARGGASVAAKRALDDVSFDAWKGEFIGVVGGSGSGKTTLGRAIMGLVSPSSGSVRFVGEPLSMPRSPAFRARTQMIFQDPYSSLDPRRKLVDAVADPLRHEADLSAAERRDRANALLEKVGLGGFGERLPHQLSGGQRQRVAIARALVREPDLVVADEPTSALDMTIQAQILVLLQTLQAERGFTCLFISHDLAAIEQVASRALVMDGGRVVETGDAGMIFAHPAHQFTRALVEASPRF